MRPPRSPMCRCSRLFAIAVLVALSGLSRQVTGSDDGAPSKASAHGLASSRPALLVSLLGILAPQDASNIRQAFEAYRLAILNRDAAAVEDFFDQSPYDETQRRRQYLQDCKKFTDIKLSITRDPVQGTGACRAFVQFRRIDQCVDK